MKKLLGALLLLVGAGLPAAAENAPIYAADGHQYSLACNAEGYVLTSLYPVAWPHGIGANTQWTDAKESLYLGKDCDAQHDLFGAGTWCWANGGFVAEFKDHRYAFGRQELICDPEPDFALACGCR